MVIKLKYRSFSIIILIISILCSFGSYPVIADVQITIDADGTISSIESGIQNQSSIYLFTQDIDGSLNVLKDNIIIDGKGYKLVNGGIQLKNRKNVTIQNIVIEEKNGLYIDSCNDILIINNTFLHVYRLSGVHCFHSWKIEVKNNTFENSLKGIYFNNITLSKIIENIFVNPAGASLELIKLTYSLVSDNIIYAGSSNLPFHLMQSNNNEFLRNWVLESRGSGIEMLQSFDNIFLENRFEAITPVFITSPEYPNTWDNGSHGNYYSDYRYRYVNAHAIGDVMDTPYVIDDNNVDNYPLKIEGSTPQPTEKIPTSIDLSGNIQVQSVDDSGDIESMSLKGKIEPALDSVLITINVEDHDHTKSTDTVTTDADGKFSKVIWVDYYGDYIIDVIFDGDGKYKASSSRIIYSVEQIQKSICIIATATFGSELTPEVQFLRGFRDNTVYSTYAGSNFMTIFNEFYYSFSPQVAQVIAGNEALRGVMKIVLYPLLGILHLSYNTFTLFGFIPELAIVLAGLVASSLIGLVYFTPGVLLFYYTKKIKPSAKITRTLTITWMGTILITVLGGVTRSSPLMMASTALFVLGTIASTTMIITKKALTYTP